MGKLTNITELRLKEAARTCIELLSRLDVATRDGAPKGEREQLWSELKGRNADYIRLRRMLAFSAGKPAAVAGDIEPIEGWVRVRR